MNEISQDRNDYISLYDLIEFAKSKNTSYSSGANDLLLLSKNKNIKMFKQYQGIKPRIEPSFHCLENILLDIKNWNGYEDPIDEIPF